MNAETTSCEIAQEHQITEIECWAFVMCLRRTDIKNQEQKGMQVMGCISLQACQREHSLVGPVTDVTVT